MTKEGGTLDYREPEWVAEKLGLDKNTVYRYLQEGTLPGVQLGRKWLISERLLAEHLERETRKQTQLRLGVHTEPIEGRPGLFRREKLPKTPRLRRAMDLAREFGWRSGADAVATEHALMGIVEVPDGLGAVVLRDLGVTVQKLREQLAIHSPPKPPQQEKRIPISHEGRQAYAYAVEEAIGMGHTYIGGEHLLLGILREPNGGGSRMLASLGITYDAARAAILKHVEGNA